MPSNHSSSDHDSDVESASSTIIYEHEPFSTFQVRVLNFTKSQIWPQASQQEIKIIRMAGGGFNRIIGLYWEADSTGEDGGGGEGEKEGDAEKSVTEYILRIPRFDAAQVDRDVAALRFVKRYTLIPAPSVVKFDETKDNTLGCPFMVQTRLHGVSLLGSYQELSPDAKCSVARQLGRVYRQMVNIESSAAGTLSLPADRDRSLDTAIYVTPFMAGDGEQSIMYNTDSTTTSARSIMVNAFARQKARCLIQGGGEDTLLTKLRDEFCVMALEMEARSWLLPENYSLAHLDLAPHNILAKLEDDGDDSQCYITGILDWDSAILGPKFMSCAPPMWLWAWNDDDEEDERLACDDPKDSDLQKVKHAFEEAAGRDYLHYAYEPEYRLARRLFKFVVQDIRSNEDLVEAEEMLQEWKELCKGGGAEAGSAGSQP